MHAGLHSLLQFYGHFRVGEHFLLLSHCFRELKARLLSDLTADKPSRWDWGVLQSPPGSFSPEILTRYIFHEAAVHGGYTFSDLLMCKYTSSICFLSSSSTSSCAFSHSFFSFSCSFRYCSCIKTLYINNFLTFRMHMLHTNTMRTANYASRIPCNNAPWEPFFSMSFC